jgi:TIGR03009 family protein
MRRPIALLLALTAGSGLVAAVCGQSIAPQRKAVPPIPRSDPAAEQAKRQQLQALLGLWEKQSAPRKTLDATFTRVDTSPAWDETDEYQGRAYLQSPNLAHLDFQKIERAKDALVLVPHEQIIFAGTHVLQYAYATKQIFVFPIAREERNRVLQEGPLPFLFNMRASELTKRYSMTLIDQNQDAYFIRIDPTLNPDRADFGHAFLWLNKRSFLPDKLLIVDVNGKDTKEYKFTSIKENARIDPQVFQGKKFAGWKVVENPSPDSVQPAERSSARPASRERR